MGRYSIKDLEKISGIKAHTIRMWERRYQLIRPQRTDTNIRYYSDCELRRLLNIAILNHNGIKVSHIAEMSDDEIRSRVLDISLDSRLTNVQVENMMVSVLELDEIKFSNALRTAILKYGFESTVETVLLPFLERVTILWQAGTVRTVQGYFINSLVRQKLFVAIDNEMQNGPKQGPRICIFLPEFEKMEIEPLMYNLIARKEGLEVIYLGMPISGDDLCALNRLKPCDIYMTSFFSPVSKEKLEKWMKELRDLFPDTPFLITGTKVREMNPSMPTGFTHIPTIKAFKEHLRLLKYSEYSY